MEIKDMNYGLDSLMPPCFGRSHTDGQVTFVGPSGDISFWKRLEETREVVESLQGPTQD